MLTKEYERDVLRTAPTGNHSAHDKVTYALMGLCGESGEAMEVWKKAMYQGHELDIDHLISEMGDVLYYVTLAAIELGFSLDELMRLNVEKRKKRYPHGFDAERSKHRAKDDI